MNGLSLKIFALGLTCLFSGTSCDRPTQASIADKLFSIQEESAIYYDLKKPDEKHFLPYVLSEVSGLTYLPDGRIACVEDEGGKVYMYDLKSRKINRSIRFHKPGDFEGIELVGEDFYALDSDGDIYHFKNGKKKEVVAEKMETPLSRKNDTEGLGYDPINNRLLIACKEDGDTKHFDAKGKAIYAYDPEKKKLSKKAVLQISTKHLKKFYETHRDQTYDEQKIKFEPSGIAFHPIEQAYYVLASVGKLLVVLHMDGTIKATYPIMPRVLNQPEGICFAPNGDLYISSEGEGDKGYILKFSMKTRTIPD